MKVKFVFYEKPFLTLEIEGAEHFSLGYDTDNLKVKLQGLQKYDFQFQRKRFDRQITLTLNLDIKIKVTKWYLFSINYILLYTLFTIN